MTGFNQHPDLFVVRSRAHQGGGPGSVGSVDISTTVEQQSDAGGVAVGGSVNQRSVARNVSGIGKSAAVQHLAEGDGIAAAKHREEFRGDVGWVTLRPDRERPNERDKGKGQIEAGGVPERIEAKPSHGAIHGCNG